MNYYEQCYAMKGCVIRNVDQINVVAEVGSLFTNAQLKFKELVVNSLHLKDSVF